MEEAGPYFEGDTAASQGRDIDENPYREGTDDHEEWNVGWTDYMESEE